MSSSPVNDERARWIIVNLVFWGPFHSHGAPTKFRGPLNSRKSLRRYLCNESGQLIKPVTSRVTHPWDPEGVHLAVLWPDHLKLVEYLAWCSVRDRHIADSFDLEHWDAFCIWILLVPKFIPDKFWCVDKITCSTRSPFSFGEITIAMNRILNLTSPMIAIAKTSTNIVEVQWWTDRYIQSLWSFCLPNCSSQRFYADSVNWDASVSLWQWEDLRRFPLLTPRDPMLLGSGCKEWNTFMDFAPENFAFREIFSG